MTLLRHVLPEPQRGNAADGKTRYRRTAFTPQSIAPVSPPLLGYSDPPRGHGRAQFARRGSNFPPAASPQCGAGP